MQTDERLAARGTREAFEELYARYRVPLYQFLLRQVGEASQAEDLFQATFLKVFRSLATFRGQSSFKTWLFAIAHNCVVDERRSARDFQELPEMLAADGPERSEEVELVRRALDELPPAHKTLFLLVRYHGMRIADAGVAVGMTAGSAKVTLLRVQKRLGERLARIRV